MPELVKNDLLLVKIAPQLKIHARPKTTAAIVKINVFWNFPPKIERGIGTHF